MNLPIWKKRSPERSEGPLPGIASGLLGDLGLGLGLDLGLRRVEQGHPLRDDAGVAPLLVLAIEVASRLKASFDLDQVPLLEVVERRLGLVSEDDHAVPIGHREGPEGSRRAAEGGDAGEWPKAEKKEYPGGRSIPAEGFRSAADRYNGPAELTETSRGQKGLADAGA